MTFSINAYGCWPCVRLGIITQTQEDTILPSSLTSLTTIIPLQLKFVDFYDIYTYHNLVNFSILSSIFEHLQNHLPSSTVKASWFKKPSFAIA